ncbi:DUF4124 domain-containing protein [Roseateles flavus]|uniref:DUF4124 domain-containing protein n=1 Tax=Roseateles flavus TaxID=3149041 RepID=A0ABV0G912_9BURK
MGGPVYRVVRPDGRVEFTDTPQGAGTVEAVRPGQQARTRSDEQNKQDYDEAKKLIKEAQKRIPKINDYLDYLSYLRSNSPRKLDLVLQELQKSDPKAWLALQKYPQFRPLRDTLVGVKAGERSLTAGLGLATGSFGGSAEKWLESSVKEMMKRDRWGPYADVLGAKASTLPAPKAPTYSNSRLGQYLKVEDARQAAAAKQSAKELESARAGIRTARATAATRVLNPLLDLGIGALDPDVFRGISAIEGMRLGKKLVDKGILEPEEALELRSLMAQGKFDEARALIDQGIKRKGGQ